MALRNKSHLLERGRVHDTGGHGIAKARHLAQKGSLMATNSSSLRSSNPLLRDFDRVSPAQSLTLTVGFDDEGWDIVELFTVGEVVASASGRLYRVIGFSLDDDVLVKPYGLGHDPLVRSLSFRPEGLRVTVAPFCGDTDERV